MRPKLAVNFVEHLNQQESSVGVEEIKYIKPKLTKTWDFSQAC